ncbi:hypothetical protein Nhal_1136 [Nitrosococcus halophilus Nc 4]|uniref:Uncharacterized protein n=1 Tax=Nitrosococcus halophilus (strain Nc4) TaxID=472759 RepID=D5BZK9_NITHN|nr:hypothetical protein Nhal_1136 [Nitrosococcus halophilus Nc 4]
MNRLYQFNQRMQFIKASSACLDCIYTMQNYMKLVLQHRHSLGVAMPRRATGTVWAWRLLTRPVFLTGE